MFWEITTSVLDDLMNYTDNEDTTSSDVTSLSNVTDIGENVTDSIIINTGNDLFKTFTKNVKMNSF